ncbi:S41 family peptidase [Halotalea alkalilenta]|nr:S41 family peptidase [Halotalea alkalilenta]
MPASTLLKRSLAGTALALMFTGAQAQQPTPTPQAPAAEQPEEAPVRGEMPLADIRAFAEAFERIKRGYVDEVDDQTLLHGAIRGMLAELDPHSSYLDADQLSDLREATEGEFGGIGIEVGLEQGRPAVISPIDDTPAARAGLRPHDLILSIDGTSTDGMSLEEAVGKMRGEIGSPITLQIGREGESEPFTVELERASIRANSVTSRRLAGDIGYVRISQFQVRTGEDLRKAIQSLNDERPVEGLVLDLRNNPGGVLNAAVDVGSVFIPSGLVVYTEGRIEGSESRFEANGDPMAPELPIVVLINSGTASAAEIVAGALQDHHRAVIMGTDSFGKGSVQTVLPLDNGGALKLTTALYYTPDGRSIQAEGIVPDVEVAPARITSEAAQQLLREADLERHLENAAPRPEQAAPEGDQEGAQDDPAATDYQLHEATNLLKALKVVERGRQAREASAPAAANDE